ncbi:response regulator [Rhodopirellula sp. SWK7]|uniref:response regulator n=1 Tax=Rhodopirellula sp. SWK7 TaxID=595460 RepID=UPI0002BFB0BA|nr:response regulator [Rhodopirellula sp. SWK7]EMI44177.1 ATP-dependent transcriptional regulator, MalT-like, LuxR family [Rhodopirellula sp. SWK7]
MTISVLVVDDHAMFRKGLRMMLDDEDDIQVVGEAGDGEEAIRLAGELLPDVIVMDITMPNTDGIEATRQIVSTLPNVKVIPLSIHSGKRFVQKMLRAGAAGYVLKESAPEELVHAVRAVHGDDIYLSSAISGVVVSEYVRLLNRSDSHDRDGGLSESDKSIVQMIAEGHSVKEIAAAQKTSASKIQTARRRIIKTLDLANVAELTEYARAQRWGEGETSVEMASSDSESLRVSILGTKFHRPTVPPDFVSRDRLLQKLDEACDVPLILVCAPAGYGKSMLVADWLAKHNERCAAWLSLSEAESDLRSFLTYVVAAVEGQFSGSCPDTTSVLHAAELPTVNVLADALGNDLDAIDEPFVLVLDDYHLIAGGEVHGLLENLLQHPPRPMRLVVITRHDPPFSLAALRGNRWLAELRQQDLRFTRDEASEVLSQITGVTVNDAALSRLEQLMEGWIVGLQLVGMLLRNCEDKEAFVSQLQGGVHQVYDYLLHEVLGRQPLPLQNCLQKMSVLDRFCAPLVEAVCQPSGDSPDSAMTGAHIIQRLRQENLFIVPLDARERWFRYHHVFQNLLTQQLDKTHPASEVRDLHGRASDWFSQQGMIDEAIRHALAAGRSEQAAEIVADARLKTLTRDASYELERWLALLPESIIGERPELLLARVWVLYFHLRFEEVPAVLDQLEPLIAERQLLDGASASGMRGEVDLFRGYLEFFAGNCADSLGHLHHAMERIPADHHPALSETDLVVGLASQMDGQREQALQRLQSILANTHAMHPTRQIRAIAATVMIHMISANLHDAIFAATRMKGIAADNGSSYAESWRDYMQGLVHLWQNERSAAVACLNKAVDRRYVLDSRAAMDAMAALALSYEMNGEQSEAEATMRMLREFVDSLRLSADIFHSCEARLAIVRGNRPPVSRWLKSAAPADEPALIFWHEVPCVTRCRALLAKNSQASLRKAEQRLEAYLQTSENTHNTLNTIQALLLQSLVLHRSDRNAESAEALHRAVALAQPGDCILFFVELGEPMAELLQGLTADDAVAEFVDRLLAEIPKPDQQKHSELAKPTTEEDGSLIETLTNRELDTLELLAQRLYDKEIAKSMGVSVWTVKTHVKHIFEKLHVKNRREAVQKAEELGLLKGK